MSIKDLEDIKKHLNKPIEEIIYYRSDGVLHGQIIYNVYSLLKDIVNILEYLDNKKEDKIDVNNIKEVKRLNEN